MEGQFYLRSLVFTYAENCIQIAGEFPDYLSDVLLGYSKKATIKMYNEGEFFQNIHTYSIYISHVET